MLRNPGPSFVQRLSRVDLEALGRRYFNSLSSHQAVAADFDAGCNRFHSGQQVTNVARNTVVKIDNIGLMMEGVETLGFTH